MFAIVATGGKQYKVAKDDLIDVEKLPLEAGKSIDLTEVLLIADGSKVTLGAPTIDGAKVTAEVVKQYRSAKIIVFKKKRRQNYRRKNTHRQDITTLKITSIKA